MQLLLDMLLVLNVLVVLLVVLLLVILLLILLMLMPFTSLLANPADSVFTMFVAEDSSSTGNPAARFASVVELGPPWGCKRLAWSSRACTGSVTSNVATTAAASEPGSPLAVPAVAAADEAA